MNRYRYLLKNIGLLTLSSFATKLLSFFLVPLYTNILSTTEYGIFDLFNTTISVLLPILTLNIQESVMRFAIDNNYNKKAIVTVATKYLFISNIIVVVGLGTNYIFGISEIIKEYTLFFFLMYFSQSLSNIVTMYVRGIDRITDLSISSIVASLGVISSKYYFFSCIQMGISWIFLSKYNWTIDSMLLFNYKSRYDSKC